MNESNPIKAIIWDMGGVLIRTENRAPRTRLAADFGLTYEMLESIVYGSRSSHAATIGAISALEHWKNVADILKITLDDIPAFKTAFWDGDVLDTELVQLTHQMRPQIKTGLLSNAYDDTREIVSKQFDFLYAFDVSVFSAEIKMAKPHADFYQWMLDQLDVSAEEAVFIDDMPENVEAANRLGIHGIRFLNHDQVITDLSHLFPF